MSASNPFETQSDQYDRWFDEHHVVYRTEVAALSKLVPEDGYGLEVGVGTGRFAAALGVDVGVDPAASMLARAADRGVDPIRGVAEALPLVSGRFDFVLLVTTMCFVDDVSATLREARRVLRPGGEVVIGFIDADSPLGQRYRQQKSENPFYRNATFHTTEDQRQAVEDAGFEDIEFVQSLFSFPEDFETRDPVRDGHGEGSFVGLGASAPPR